MKARLSSAGERFPRQFLRKVPNVSWVDMLMLGGIATLAFDLLVLAPLSLVPSLRLVTGGTIFASSYLFGFLCWLTGCFVTYVLWGTGAVIAGVVSGIIGVVPMGMVASVIKGQWQLFVDLAVLLSLTFGMRWLGYSISARHKLQVADVATGHPDASAVEPKHSVARVASQAFPPKERFCGHCRHLFLAKNRVFSWRTKCPNCLLYL